MKKKKNKANKVTKKILEEFILQDFMKDSIKICKNVVSFDDAFNSK